MKTICPSHLLIQQRWEIAQTWTKPTVCSQDLRGQPSSLGAQLARQFSIICYIHLVIVFLYFPFISNVVCSLQESGSLQRVRSAGPQNVFLFGSLIRFWLCIIQKHLRKAVLFFTASDHWRVLLFAPLRLRFTLITWLVSGPSQSTVKLLIYSWHLLGIWGEEQELETI